MKDLASKTAPPGIALMALLVIGMSQPAGAQTLPSAVRVFDSGTHIETFRANNLSVRYVISVPERYASSKSVPLVLALHYGGNPNGAAQGVLLTLVKPALAELEAVIVAPESLGGAWNSAANERTVLALLEAVRASYRIDAKRIAVTGFSMGGSGTWFFAGKYPDLFSVAIPVAGMPPASAGMWRTPVFAVHSRNDDVMPIEPTVARINELRKTGIRAELVVLSGISHSETSRFVPGLRNAVPWIQETWKSHQAGAN